MRHANGWTEERAAKLIELCKQGRSATQMADELGGLTRNAVIGKLHRMGYAPSSISPVRKQPRPRRQRPKLTRLLPIRPKLAELPTEPMPPPEQIDVSAIDFDGLEAHHCRWPTDIPFKGFCGCKKVEGLPYCTYHARRAYQPARPVVATVRGPGRLYSGRVGAVMRADVHKLQSTEELVDA